MCMYTSVSIIFVGGIICRGQHLSHSPFIVKARIKNVYTFQTLWFWRDPAEDEIRYSSSWFMTAWNIYLYCIISGTANKSLVFCYDLKSFELKANFLFFFHICNLMNVFFFHIFRDRIRSERKKRVLKSINQVKGAVGKGEKHIVMGQVDNYNDRKWTRTAERVFTTWETRLD